MNSQEIAKFLEQMAEETLPNNSTIAGNLSVLQACFENPKRLMGLLTDLCKGILETDLNESLNGDLGIKPTYVILDNSRSIGYSEKGGLGSTYHDDLQEFQDKESAQRICDKVAKDTNMPLRVFRIYYGRI